MNLRHRVSTLTLCVLALAACGCTSNEVVYVDEQGNALAVDRAGQPVTPRPDPARTRAAVTTTPDLPWDGPVQPSPAIEARPAAPDAPPAGALPPVPRMDDLPVPPRSAPRPAESKPAGKKVETSSGLGGPPAG